MKVFLAKHQRVDVDEAVGPIINWVPTIQDGQVDSFEQMWSVECHPELVLGCRDLAATMQVNQEISRLHSGPLDVFFQLKVDQTSYKPLKFIRVEDNNENIKDLLKALKVNPGSEKQLSLEVVIDVGREAIKFKKLCFLTEEPNDLDAMGFQFVEIDDEEISCQDGWACLSVFHDDVYFTIVLDIPDPTPNELYCQGSQILLDDSNSDMKIICSDGEIITCLKSILFANSPVLKTELEGNYVEAKTSTIQMDFESDVVKATLKYLYCRDLETATSSPDVVVKLLQIANYYSIGNLWDAVVSTLETANLRTLTVAPSLELFSFINLVSTERKDYTERLNGINLKLVYVLSKKLDTEVDSSDFRGLYENNQSFRIAWIDYSLQLINA